MASATLSGIIIHTNVGDMRRGLSELAEYPPMHSLEISLGHYNLMSGPGPFYIYNNYLDTKHNYSKIERIGIPAIQHSLKAVRITGLEAYTRQRIEQPIAHQMSFSWATSDKAIEILFLELPTEVFARICEKHNIPVYLHYESNGEEAYCFRRLPPKPIRDSEWIIFTREMRTVFEPDINGGGVVTGYHRIRNYKYVWHIGALLTASGREGYYRSHFPYIYRKHSSLANRLFFAMRVIPTTITIKLGQE
ncbi:MAG: hypothetical protein LBS17_05385 [Actinomycetes bacterium]|nr:hypothetical protein [Actinomycetes bacterium]